MADENKVEHGCSEYPAQKYCKSDPPHDKALVRFAHDGHRRASREEEMIKQINEFIDWPALEEKLSPTDREVYENLKSSCQRLMASESPNHEEVSKQIRTAQEFLITNPSLDPVSARELWRCFLSSCSLSNDNTEESREVKEEKEDCEKHLEMVYKRRAEKNST